MEDRPHCKLHDLYDCPYAHIDIHEVDEEVARVMRLLDSTGQHNPDELRRHSEERG